MTALSLSTARDQFSVVTISDMHSDTPVWNRRLGWPVAGDTHVALDTRSATHRDIWAAKIDQAVMRTDRAVLLIAEGLGCVATAWWARLSPRHYSEQVAGALLFDPQEPDGPSQSLLASPAITLPFPTMVVTGRDRGNAGETLEQMANAWGSRMLVAERHRKAGAWRAAQRLICRMSAAVVANDIQRGMALRGE